MTDRKLLWIAREFREGILDDRKSSEGMCFAVCAALVGYLKFIGINAEMIESDLSDRPGEWQNHFWLKLSDARALDPTADQFDDLSLPPVYLGPAIPAIHVLTGGNT